MSVEDLIGVIAPILLSMIISLFPTVAGDPIDKQARDLIGEWKKAGLKGQLALDAEVQAASFAKGATLSAGIVGMILTYIWGAWSCLKEMTDALWWTIGIASWGVLALVYLWNVAQSHKLYEWALTKAPKPFGKAGDASFKFTHFDAITVIVVGSGVIIMVLAGVAFYTSSIAPAAAAPAAAAAGG